MCVWCKTMIEIGNTFKLGLKTVRSPKLDNNLYLILSRFSLYERMFKENMKGVLQIELSTLCL